MKGVFLDPHRVNPFPNRTCQPEVAAAREIRNDGRDGFATLKDGQMFFSCPIQLSKDIRVVTTETVHQSLDIQSHDDLPSSTTVIPTVSVVRATTRVIEASATTRIVVTVAVALMVVSTSTSSSLFGRGIAISLRGSSASSSASLMFRVGSLSTNISIQNAGFPIALVCTLAIPALEVI
jgi:hypothetical protein